MFIAEINPGGRETVMDSEIFSFDEIYPLIQGCVVKDTKRGHFGGLEEHIMYFVEAYEPQQGTEPPAGRWIVKYNSEMSYVSPALYHTLYKFSMNEVLGQTMADGTALTPSTVYDRLGSLSRKRRCSTPITDTQNSTKKFKTTPSDPLPDLMPPNPVTPAVKTRKPRAPTTDHYGGLDKENRKLIRALRQPRGGANTRTTTTTTGQSETSEMSLFS